MSLKFNENNIDGIKNDISGINDFQTKSVQINLILHLI